MKGILMDSQTTSGEGFEVTKNKQVIFRSVVWYLIT